MFPQPGALIQQAVQLFQQGDLVRAAKHLQQALLAQPKNFDALHILGVIRGLQADAKEAAKLDASLAATRQAKDKANREAFDLAKQVELAKVSKRNAEFDIQRTTEMISKRAEQSSLTRPPPPPPARRLAYSVTKRWNSINKLASLFLLALLSESKED